jgi:hypothetical protein
MSDRSRLALLALGSLLIIAVPSFANVSMDETSTDPSYLDEGLALTVTGLLTGLDDTDVQVTVTARAEVRGVCRSQTGSELPVAFLAEAHSVATEFRSEGTVTYSVTTVAPESPVPGAPGCPDPTWEQIVEDVVFTSATIKAEQQGVVVYDRSDGI